jgi:putative DNA primase/helicase
MFLLFGHGQNGKGTFLKALAHILGDYAVSADMATFTLSRHDRHPTEIAKLAGARLVTASETERGRTWAWSRIKELTGNERPISGRFMRQDFFEFNVTFKLVFAGNNKPKLPSTDEATARRINLLPFAFRAAEPDLALKDKLVAEYPAILRWAIDGCLDWQAHRLVRPGVVLLATQAYLAEQDLFTVALSGMLIELPASPLPTAEVERPTS